MRVMVFGATGELGRECVAQALEAGHAVSVYVRTPSRLDEAVRERVEVHEGDGLDAAAVAHALSAPCDAILFAIGIDKHSPENLCTTATRHIFAAMREQGIRRFVWCGGGSTLVEKDRITFGARFVEFFARTFMGLRHRDKARQLELLAESTDLDWIGLRPLQMVRGERREVYRVGYDAFSGTSRIHFADCAHAMLAMLDDDTWIHEAPIIQY